MPQEIKAMIIIEVMGKPPEHLKEVLKDLIQKIDQEKGIKVTSNKINEPVLLQNQKEFYTNFAEVEFTAESIIYLTKILLSYMPAHLDIIYPEKITLTNNDGNDIFNEISRKLHKYDETARILQTEKAMLIKRLKEFIPEKKE